MPITLDVNTELDNASARKTAAQAQAYFRDAGRGAGNDFSTGLNRGLDRVDTGKARKQADGLSKAYDRAADAAGRVRVEQARYDDMIARGESDRTKLIRQTERLSKARRDEGNAIRSTRRAYRDFERAGHDVVSVGRSVSRSSAGVTDSLTRLGGAARGLGAIGSIGTVAVIGGLAATLVDLAGVAASAAKSLWLLPAAASAAGAAFGTLKIGMMGFGDAMDDLRDPEKFAEDLQKLSPNAQQAALAIEALLPAFDQLKDATQDALFAGVGQELNALANTFGPTIQQMTTGVAGAFNQMFSGIANQLMTPETQTSIKAFVDNVVIAFQNLAPAMAPLTKAFADITAVGSGFLPQLATAAANAAKAFSDFISKAQQSGQLKQWLGEGLHTLKLLGEGAWNIGRAFMALAPTGERVLPGIVHLLGSMADIMPAIGRAAELMGPQFGAWAAVIDKATGAVTRLEQMFPPLANSVILAANKVKNAIDAGFFTPIRETINLFNKLPLPDIPNAPEFPDIPMIKAVGPGYPGHGFPGGGGSPDAPWADAGLPLAGLPGIPSGGYAVPAPPPDAGGSSMPYIPPGQWQLRSATPGPGNFGTGGLGGPAGDSRTFDAQSRVLSARHSLEEARLRLAQLEAKGNAGQMDLLRARNNIVERQRSLQSAEMNLAEARQKTLTGQTKKMASLTDGMGQIGAALDKDLGISKGLPGIADNLVRFLASLAFAPALGALSAVKAANGGTEGKGSGLIGIMAAQGGFGAAMASPAALGPVGLGGGMPQAMGADFGSGPSLGLPSASALPEGLASPAGLQPNTERANRMISALFPQVNSIGGFRPDPGYPGEHGAGRALDVMVGGNKALGDRINRWAMNNAAALGANYTIWQHGQWNPDGSFQMYPDRGGPTANHMDHVHINFAPGPLAGGGGGAAMIPTPSAMGPFTGGVGMQPGMTPGRFRQQYGGGFGTGYVGAPGVAGSAPAATGLPVGGRAPSPGIGGGFSGVGGLPLAALQTAASALNVFPGAGIAAQIGIQEANRAAAYAGQMGGIAMSGLLQTFTLNDSPLADPSHSWLGRIIGGFAGAKPALPNMAGQKAPKQQEKGKKGKAGPPPAGPEAYLKIENYQSKIDDPDAQAREFAHMVAHSYRMPGVR